MERLRQAVAGNSPPDCCIFDIQIPLKEKTTPIQADGCYFWRSERDLNPRALFRRLLP